MDSIALPAVALLNVGQEEMKGNECVKAAHELLSRSDLNYVGFVEGDGIYSREDVHVVVCDGFAGNVALKASEGLAQMISFYLQREFRRNWLNKCIAVIAMPILRALRRAMDPRQYNGASLVGLRGIVVKSHGGADAFAFTHAIHEARVQVLRNVPENIGQHIGFISERIQRDADISVNAHFTADSVSEVRLEGEMP